MKPALFATYPENPFRLADHKRHEQFTIEELRVFYKKHAHGFNFDALCAEFRVTIEYGRTSLLAAEELFGTPVTKKVKATIEKYEPSGQPLIGEKEKRTPKWTPSLIQLKKAPEPEKKIVIITDPAPVPFVRAPAQYSNMRLYDNI